MIKVLVIDDELATRNVMTSIFDFMSIKTLTAENSEEALAICEKERPEAIFIDYFLPDTNGIELMKKIRALYKENIIFFVSQAQDQQISDEAIESGAVKFITKPFTRDQIRDCLIKNIQIILKNQRIPKILIADDEEDILFSLPRILNKKIQCDARTTNNGLDAYNILSKEDFDLILLDIHMPGKNGIELIKSLPDLPKKSYIMVITGYRGFDIINELKKLNILDVIHKPFTPDSLWPKIQSVLITKGLYLEKQTK